MKRGFKEEGLKKVDVQMVLELVLPLVVSSGMRHTSRAKGLCLERDLVISICGLHDTNIYLKVKSIS